MRHELSSVEYDDGVTYAFSLCVFIDAKVNRSNKHLMDMRVYAFTDGTDTKCELDEQRKGWLLAEVAGEAVRAFVGYGVGDGEFSTTHAMAELLRSVFEGSTSSQDVQIHNGGYAERKIGGLNVTFRIADNGFEFTISP
jgi:hypothetical protein